MPPCIEVIRIESAGVLCQSALMGNNTERVGSQYFTFP